MGKIVFGAVEYSEYSKKYRWVRVCISRRV